MPKLEALDVRILDTLQTNGKLTNVELSKIVGLSPSPRSHGFVSWRTVGLFLTMSPYSFRSHLGD